MDPRLHHVQREAEHVKPADLLDLLDGLYRDKIALTERHQEAARGVTHYDFNNAYQYVLARDETHLAWLRRAIGDLGGTVPESADLSAGGPPSHEASVAKQDVTEILQDDVKLAQSLVDRWRERVEGVTNARHKGMINVIVGETREHVRTFQQALAGRTDLLGRRAEGAGTPGRVLPTRWLE